MGEHASEKHRERSGIRGGLEYPQDSREEIVLRRLISTEKFHLELKDNEEHWVRLAEAYCQI